MKLFLNLLIGAATLVACAAESYTVTLRGKRIPLNGSSLTISDVKTAAASSSPGLAPADMKILCNGETLEGDDKKLEECGIKDGAVVNVVPTKKKVAKKKSAKSSSVSPPSTPSSPAPSEASPGGFAGMDEILKSLGQEGGDAPDLASLLGSMGANGMPTDPKESLKMMQKMLASPVVSGYLADPAKIEQARQTVLSNPMMKAALSSSLPGFDEILSSPERWRSTMVSARDMYVNMGEAELEMLSKMMEQGPAGGMGGGFGGMGGGMGGAPGAGAMSKDDKMDELDDDED
ncbi:hypothetical protein TrST_g13035 [Triparma strigata]|uniref:Ubiquitin-like domain-containing protein n=1 Tax=Triparma strigata TaxID=1606541 RepID=A0A9W7DYX6_9STRA|nr:hypothetical protein TrST_g13035 [Triparma strigata]